MNDEALSTKDFLVLSSIGFVVVCALVAYLLYWFVRRSKTERFSKIKFRSRKSKSLGKAVRRSKLGEEKVKAPKKGTKMDEEVCVKMERRTKDESSTSSSNKSLRQAELQEDLQAAVKLSSEQPLDYGADVRAVIYKQQSAQQPEYDVELGQSPPPPPPPPPQKMPQIRLPSEAAKSREKSLVLVEPNRFLKEAGIAPDQELAKDRLKSFTSRVDTGRSNLMAKKMDSVVAYQTSPISLEGGQEADLTPSLLSTNNAPLSKFASKPDDSNKNTASILSVTNSQMPGEAGESYIGGADKGSSLSANKSNIANDNQRASNISYGSSKEMISKSGSTSSARTKNEPQSRKYETKRKPTN